MDSIDNSISGNSLALLSSLIGKKLMAYSHEPFDKGGLHCNDFFMRLGILLPQDTYILDNRVDWFDNWFSAPQYIPHFVFAKTDSEGALRTYAGFTLEQFETFKVGENIEDIVLVQDEIEITKNGEPHQKLLSTEGIVIITNVRQYAFYKDNTLLDETVLEFKGHDVLSKLENARDHWQIFAKPFDASCKRSLLHLKSHKEEVLSDEKIAGVDYGDK